MRCGLSQSICFIYFVMQEVNEMWCGLGYYSRGRRLHEGAQKVRVFFFKMVELFHIMLLCFVKYHNIFLQKGLCALVSILFRHFILHLKPTFKLIRIQYQAAYKFFQIFSC